MCLYIKTKTILHPTEIGAPKFEPTNISIFKQEKNAQLKSYYTSKFEELTNQWQDLLEDMKESTVL